MVSGLVSSSKRAELQCSRSAVISVSPALALSLGHVFAVATVSWLVAEQSCRHVVATPAQQVIVLCADKMSAVSSNERDSRLVVSHITNLETL